MKSFLGGAMLLKHPFNYEQMTRGIFSNRTRVFVGIFSFAMRKVFLLFAMDEKARKPFTETMESLRKF